MTRLEAAYRAIEIGDKKAAEGDEGRARTAYETAVRDFMHLSFVACNTTTQVKAWLKNHPIDYATERLISITQNPSKIRYPVGAECFRGGNYLLIAFSHFFSALGQYERARYFTQFAAEPQTLSTTFWGEYGKMYASLEARRTYLPQFRRLRFSDRYILPYVELMSSAMHGKSLDTAISEIDRQFIARNADRRMNGADPYMIEGSPEFPVKFDFRKAGLLSTIQNARLNYGATCNNS